MDLSLRGRTALVTGASQGIGRCLARLLALEGVRVVAAARRVELVQTLATETRAEGGEVIEPVAFDLYQPQAGERLAEIALKSLGQIDILMNVAGGSRTLPFDAESAQWLEAMTLNFFRVRELTHAVVPSMRKAKWGRVINFTGTSEPLTLNAASSAKAAVHVWSKSLSREVGPDGITVNCIQPGRIRSEQISRLYPTRESEEQFSKDYVPIGRFGEPEEIASLAVFLASPIAGYITGTVIPVDGGLRFFSH